MEKIYLNFDYRRATHILDCDILYREMYPGHEVWYPDYSTQFAFDRQ